MKSIRKVALFILLMGGLGMGYWGGQGCVQARTDNPLDPSRAGWEIWFSSGQGSCKFGVHKFSDACSMR